MKKIYQWSCFIILIGGLLFTPRAQGQMWFMGNPLLGEPAPNFTLETLKMSKNSFLEYRDGNAAIVFFWATWCPHCREQLTQLENQREEIENKGIKVALVDLGESKEKVQSFLEGKNISFDVFLDKKSTVAEEYSIIGVPTFFFIDKDGYVLAVEHFMPDNLEDIFVEKSS